MQGECPALNDTHLLRMIDDTGIYQHALFGVPDPRYGYTTDDNARLMLVGAWGWRATRQPKYLELCYKGLRFLLAAERDGWFRNFMGWNRSFLEKQGSEDCFGRCIWCLCVIAADTALPAGLRSAAENLLERTLPNVLKLQAFRARAYAVLGITQLGQSQKRVKVIKQLLQPMAEAFEHYQQSGWAWFEQYLTYCNAIMPHAFLAAGKYHAQWQTLGLQALDFLIDKTLTDGIFTPIGNQGWLVRGKTQALYDQQPVEACCTLLACLTAHRLTNNNRYLMVAESCHSWFTGGNTLHINMIDADSGGCCDGLHAQGPNYNQGAESVLSWFGASWALYLHKS